MKKLCLPLILFCCLVLTSCGKKPPEDPVLPGPEKITNIEDVTKTYFSDQTSEVTIILRDYILTNDNVLSYEVSSSDTSVATVNVENDTLTATLLKGSGYTDILINVLANEEFVFSLGFRITAREFTKIACVGDSLTYGHSWHDSSYPVYLASELGISVENCGVNGRLLQVMVVVVMVISMQAEAKLRLHIIQVALVERM